MTLRLRFTPGSPFARVVRVVLAERRLDYEAVEDDGAGPAEERRPDAPTLMVPALRDGDLRLWDSLVIVEHLMTRHPARRGGAPDDPPLAPSLLRRDRETQDRLALATLQTLCASITLVSQLRWSGVGLENGFVARNVERVDHLLDWCEEVIRDAGDGRGFVPGILSVQDIFLASALSFAENRPIGIDWRSRQRDRVGALVDRLERRQSFIANPVRWWEPGVTGYRPDGTPTYA